LLKYSFTLSENLVIPKAHDSISQSFQLRSSLSIVSHLTTVLSAIGFDNQSGFHRCEIYNKRFNHHLSPKFVTHLATRTQMLPQYTFRFAGLAAKGSGAYKQFF